ncbi:FecR domain-containing protein [Allorhodopirellula solitaria]|uniref:FecR protein n=1 Tax=Allorhodopirellula solitaria TaxID=2527987 RepID=A0A5C5XVT5_9BACT|nr:FecR domain-containing protein [Allorhodopirellula solitaria]TWT67446.1 FecR protein [Allorhodopirellula solitaria]
MNEPSEKARFEFLVNSLIDQRITRAQTEELERYLLDCPERQQRYLDRIEVHVTLTRILGGMRFSPSPARVSLATKQPRWLRRTLIGPIAVVAASLLVIATASLLQHWQPNVDVSRPVAMSGNSRNSDAEPTDNGLSHATSVVFAQNSGAEFFGSLAPEVGTVLEMNRQFILTEGMIELAFPKGATALVDAPAIFSVVSSERLFLEAGQCSVHAPEGAQGFEVETPLANVIDLGTRFGVGVDSSGETNVQVIEGAAEVIEKSPDGEAISAPELLTANDSAVYPHDLQRSRGVSALNPPIYRYGLPDRILQYQAAPAPSPDARGVQELLSISVQRGGTPFQYEIDDIIPTEVTYFRSTQRDEVQPVAYRYGDNRPIAELLQSDNSLDTGIFNPGASKQALTSSPTENTVGMTFRFDRPVVNSIGPDIVFFELQSYSNPKMGDAFHVSPLEFRRGLHSHTVREFDIPMNSPEALKVAGFGVLRFEHQIDSIADLYSGRHSQRYRHFNFRALAVGIDLSDLGYDENEVVDGIFVQDADDDETHNGGSMVDPVYVGGFPPIDTDLRHVESTTSVHQIDSKKDLPLFGAAVKNQVE